MKELEVRDIMHEVWITILSICGRMLIASLSAIVVTFQIDKIWESLDS